MAAMDERGRRTRPVVVGPVGPVGLAASMAAMLARDHDHTPEQAGLAESAGACNVNVRSEVCRTVKTVPGRPRGRPWITSSSHMLDASSQFRFC